MNFKNVINPLKTHIKGEEIRSVPGLKEKIDLLFEMMEQENSPEPRTGDPYLQGLAVSVYFLLERYFTKNNASYATTAQEAGFTTRGSTLIYHLYALSRSRTHVHRPLLPALPPYARLSEGLASATLSDHRNIFSILPLLPQYCQGNPAVKIVSCEKERNVFLYP